MKKFLLIALMLFALANLSNAQVMQRKSNTPASNTNGKTITTLHPVKQKPVLLTVRSNVDKSMIKKLISYTKTVTYPDKSQLHISLRTSPSWAGQASAVTPTATQTGSKTNGDEVCSSYTVSLSATSTDFMNNNYSAQSMHIYPGAIYAFDHLFDGTFREETTNRNPIIIGTDNPNVAGDTYELVADPNQTNIHNSVAKLVRRFSGPVSNESTSYQVFDSYNSSDLNIKVGAAGSGYGASFSNVFDASNVEQHIYLTIDARKTLFSIGVPAPDSGYFKGHANETADMAIMGSVSYGVRVLANLEYTFKSKKDADNFKAAYSGFGVNGNVNLDLLAQSTSASTTVNAYVVGGPSSETKIAFNTAELKQQLQNIIAGVNYQNAQPISYELFDMRGNVIGEQSATDKFTVNQCLPLGKLQNPYVTFRSGDDGKDKDTHFVINLFTNDNKLAATYTNNSNTDEYPDNSSRGINMTVLAGEISGAVTNVVPVTFTQENFTTNGGHLHLNITPNGHDTWKIGSLELTLQFGSDQHQITWNNVELSQNGRDVDLWFDSAFRAKQ